MSDGVIRMCREHDMELRLLGPHFVCPFGHSCDVDWYVKTASVARTSPALPLPVVVEVVAPSAAVASSEPKQKSRREAPMPKPKVVHPHGTHQRYWATCRCERCRAAINKYLKDKKREKAAAVGGASPLDEPSAKRAALAKPRKTYARRATKRTPALPARRTADAVIVSPVNTDLSVMVDRIAALDAQLRAAEAEFARGVNGLLRGWKIVPAVEAAQ